MEATIDLQALGQAAQAASYTLATLPTSSKNKALHAIADALEDKASSILAANTQDVAAGRDAGLSEALLDRLMLTESRLAALAADTRQVATLPDPVGNDIEGRLLPSGLRLSKRRIPIGVIGVIYEARPNVTIDIAGLCLKTGNAAILRGGKETVNSNRVLTEVIQQGLEAAGLPAAAVQCIDSPDRALVAALLRMDEYVDMIIPRGGAGLHRLCREQSTIPVITGGIGICHIYVDPTADMEAAVNIIENAKTQRPSVCNAMDTLLVHEAAAETLLPALARRLQSYPVAFRADAPALAVLDHHGLATHATPAGPGDFDQEWLSLVMGIKTVSGVDEAVAHIRAHSSGHSEAILTNDQGEANRFVNAVNSAAVFVNASTRFNDGGQFGLGAEVAVSTQKLHARGPMGLEELTTYKWVCVGDGHVRG